MVWPGKELKFRRSVESNVGMMYDLKRPSALLASFVPSQATRCSDCDG